MKEIPMDSQDTNIAFIGTYTKKEAHVDGKADGIYAVVQNSETGTLKFAGTKAEITNPSFVLVSEDEKNLYAVSELGPSDAESGFIYSFDIGPYGTLEKTGKLSTGGFAPCHIASDKTGNFIFVSNYSGGVVMVYRKKKDGSLEQWKRLDLGTPQSSHPHSVTVSPDNRNIYIADLGEDKIWIYD
ncbi:MAG TPA: beta-propeller fold lactonase family protein, partial [Salinimicrobium sp.]|nr:beta-propeller fold lactonase family protein [Salinimicrobium sp.]